MPPFTVIPRPLRLEPREGRFRLGERTEIRCAPGSPALAGVAAELAVRLRRATGLPLPVRPAGADGGGFETDAVVLELAGTPAEAGEEGYRLEAGPRGLAIRGATTTGVARGVQTLRQLLPPQVESRVRTAPPPEGWAVPAVLVEDRPRFAWRGLLLDCCRHFMTPAYVKRVIDLLALHKMNVLHWHLTEDQGWRLAVRRHPELTEVGAWRAAPGGGRYGGFYGQDEVREIVAHARRRHVTVVPEIEMPGHALAALAARPDLSCSGGPFAVATDWGVFPDVFCAGNDDVFALLEDVLDEVLELFPSPHVHVGGDECPRDRWRACPRCRARVAAEGLRDADELQAWFLRRIARFLADRGRRLVGWDEILEPAAPRGAVVQAWRGLDRAAAAARAGHDVIVSPTSHAYLDYDVAITDLRRVHSFEPVPPQLAAADRARILGGECTMWTERAPQEEVDARLFPRLLAMAEVLWSPAEGRDWSEFLPRVRRHHARLELLGVRGGPESAPA